MTIAALGLAATLAATAPAMTGQNSPVVEELVVHAVVPGPAWWKAEKNGKVIYILGLPGSTLSRGQRWDRTATTRRLNRADVILMPTRTLKRTEGDRPEPDLESTLPPELRARFVSARQTLRFPAERYAKLTLLQAADRLSEDLWRRYRLSREEGFDAFRNLARDAKARRVEFDPFNGPPGMLTREVQLRCLTGVVRAVEAGRPAFQRASRAWAEGDLRGVLNGPRGDRWWVAPIPRTALSRAT